MQNPQRIERGTTEAFSLRITINFIIHPETKMAIMLFMYQYSGKMNKSVIITRMENTKASKIITILF
jgi:hypothetical protein